MSVNQTIIYVYVRYKNVCKSANLHNCECNINPKFCLSIKIHKCCCEKTPNECIATEQHICGCRANADYRKVYIHVCSCRNDDTNKCKLEIHNCICQCGDSINCKSLYHVYYVYLSSEERKNTLK